MNIRMNIATALTWAATKIAPRDMSSIFACYGEMLRVFPNELRLGRTYGVVTAVWGFTPKGRSNATMMQMAAIAAAGDTRRELEKVS
jgi:hypothetical protein